MKCEWSRIENMELEKDVQNIVIFFCLPVTVIGNYRSAIGKKLLFREQEKKLRIIYGYEKKGQNLAKKNVPEKDI